MDCTARPGKMDELQEEMRKEFDVVESGESSLRASATKDKLERFLDKHQGLIDKGLIAAPGSVVQQPSGARYHVQEDGSWRRVG